MLLIWAFVTGAPAKSLRPRAIPRVPVVELGAPHPAVLIANWSLGTARTQAITPRIDDLEVNLLRPFRQPPPLDRQRLPNVFHLRSENELTGVQAIEFLRQDANRVLYRKRRFIVWDLELQRSLRTGRHQRGFARGAGSS